MYKNSYDAQLRFKKFVKRCFKFATVFNEIETIYFLVK